MSVRTVFLLFFLCGLSFVLGSCLFSMELNSPGQDRLLADVEMGLPKNALQSPCDGSSTWFAALRIKQRKLSVCSCKVSRQVWFTGCLCVATVALGIMWAVYRFSEDDDSLTTPLSSAGSG